VTNEAQNQLSVCQYGVRARPDVVEVQEAMARQPRVTKPSGHLPFEVRKSFSCEITPSIVVCQWSAELDDFERIERDEGVAQGAAQCLPEKDTKDDW
jgi:hypothetical protein